MGTFLDQIWTIHVRHGARSGLDARFNKDFHFDMIPLSNTTSYRATIDIEEYTVGRIGLPGRTQSACFFVRLQALLSSGFKIQGHGLSAGDAIIAATAVEHNMPLCTSNSKHFKIIQDLQPNNFKA